MPGNLTGVGADGRITLAHGGGGSAMRSLIDEVFLAVFTQGPPAVQEDQARLDLTTLAQAGDRLAFTTDAFVVEPLEFPGGNIGTLAVCGTVNDLAVGGATPVACRLHLCWQKGWSLPCSAGWWRPWPGVQRRLVCVLLRGIPRLCPAMPATGCL